MESVLIIDDDDAIRRTLELHLSEQRFEVYGADNLVSGRALWNEREPDIVVLDLKLPDGDGTALLQEQTAAQSPAMVVMITGHQDMEYAIRAMKSGAFNYIHKPLDIDELDAVLAKAAQQVRARRRTQAIGGGEPWKPNRIAGSSRAILEIHKQIGLASKSRVSVLISGESGTGKELVARAIHQNSAADEPFVAMNCSAIVPTLFESELFGHERGSFTGAHQRKIGKLELAGSGSLFLDEIGDLTTDAQSKLLRVLQERTFERVGGNMAIPFEARVIAASHRNLGELIKEGRFREDLFFRLKVVEIHVPPLRDRVEDIPAITDYLLEKINRELHRSITKIPESVMRRLQRNDWPGNVRELENVLTQAVLHSTGDTLTLDFLREPAESPPGELATLAEMEKQHIAKVLRAVDWNLGNACEVLGISRPTLRKKMEDYGISAPGP
ncbi:sigma-54 dependent transcriptional regulator [bacterium]|nr:sigma-54 dependent transcriptional regulator [bacterium]